MLFQKYILLIWRNKWSRFMKLGNEFLHTGCSLWYFRCFWYGFGIDNSNAMHFYLSLSKESYCYYYRLFPVALHWCYLIVSTSMHFIYNHLTTLENKHGETYKNADTKHETFTIDCLCSMFNNNKKEHNTVSDQWEKFLYKQLYHASVC